MVANRVPGVRAPLCWNQEIARLGREHNDANGLALGARVIDLDLALEIVRTWLDTSFEGGRHLPRIRKSTSRGAGHELLLPMRRTRRGHHLRTSRATLRRAAWTRRAQAGAALAPELRRQRPIRSR